MEMLPAPVKQPHPEGSDIEAHSLSNQPIEGTDRQEGTYRANRKQRICWFQPIRGAGSVLGIVEPMGEAEMCPQLPIGRGCSVRGG